MLLISQFDFSFIITRLWEALHQLQIKPHLLWVVILMGVVISVNDAIANGFEDNGVSQQTDRLIVKFKSPVRQKGIDQTIEQRLSHKLGLTLKKLTHTINDVTVFELPEMMDLQTVYAMSEQLREEVLIEYAEPDRIVLPKLTPNDEYFQNQWHYHDNNQVIGGVNLPMAWNITTGDENMVIAVIDTGLLAHTDLAGRIISGYDMISSTRIGADGNGRDSDPTDMGDWTEQDECYRGSPSSSSTWHGTHVAGTLGAATNNGIGVAGVNWKAKIMPIRAMGKCGGYMSDIADSIRWAAGAKVDNVPNAAIPAKVINLSLGGMGSCGHMEQQAINEAVQLGAIVVVAAGNESANVTQSTPANCQQVIAVAAVTAAGVRAYYSNIGEQITIAAPGGNWSKGIMSTFNGGYTLAEAQSYHTMMGTSMAAPHVTGVISLMLSVNPFLSLKDVTRIIRETANSFPIGTARDCDELTCGAGIIDAAKAVMSAGNNMLPVISVVRAQRVNGGDVVVLQGSAYDADGQVNELWWSQTSGEKISLLEGNGGYGSENEIRPDNSVEKSVHFIAPELPQRLGFTFTAKDDKEALSSAEVNIDINAPPVADAGGDQVVLPKSLVVLDASDSTDDLSVQQYHWQQSSGKAVIVDYAFTATPEFVASSLSGAIEFTLRVEDEDGLFDEDTTTVYVNEKPVAKAGADQLVNGQTTIELDGSASTDRDGAIQSYRWIQRSGTPVNIIDARLAVARFVVPDNMGALAFELTVVDNLGFSSTDTVTVNINRPPVAVVSESLLVNPGQRVLLSGENSYDLENKIDHYLWQQQSGPLIQLETMESATTQFIAPESDVEIKFMVTDGLGLTSSVLVRVIINQEPIASAGEDRVVLPNSSIVLDASDSRDNHNEIATYLWRQIAGEPVTLLSTATPKIQFSSPSHSATLVFELQVTDAMGLTGSDQVSVVINEPPFAQAGPEQLINPGDDVILDGRQSIDPDGAIVHYRWQQTAGPYVDLDDSENALAGFVLPSGNIMLTFQLSVADDYGYTSTDTVVIKANQSPIANAGITQWVNSGDTVALTGLQSIDMDNGIQRYAWRQVVGEPVVLSDTVQAVVDFQAPSVAAVLVFELKVTDSGGLSGYHLVSIVVNENTFSLFSHDMAVLPGNTVNLSSLLVDDQAVKVSYQWQQLVGSQVELNTSSTGTVTFLAPENPDQLIFQVMADDTDGVQSLGVVQVDVINVAPRFLLPEAFVVAQGQALSFSVGVSDSNHTPVHIMADALPDQALFDRQTGTFFWDATNEVGEYLVRFIAFDSLLSSSQTIQTVKITVVSPGQLQFTEPQVQIHESAGEVTISLQRMAGYANDVAVDVVLQAGTAQANDYVFATERVQWSAGDILPKQITIPIINDIIEEQDESFFLYLTNPQGEATLGDLNTMQIVINDDDRLLRETVRFKQTSLQVSEGQEAAQISLIRQGTGQGTLRVDYQTSAQTAQENSDYQSVSGTLTWSEGSETEQFFSIPIVNDKKAENDESLLVELQIHWTEANTGAGNQGTKTSTLIIKDNDPRCFIATAAYGTGMAPEVRYLRAFRDDYLLTNSLGNQLVDWYYQYSPPLADYLRNHPTFRSVVRASLQPLIAMSKLLSSEQSYRLQTASKP